MVINTSAYIKCLISDDSTPEMDCICWYCTPAFEATLARSSQDNGSSHRRVDKNTNRYRCRLHCCQIRSSNLAIIDRKQTHQIKLTLLSKPSDKLRFRPEDCHAIISGPLKLKLLYQSSSVALSSFNIEESKGTFLARRGNSS